MVIDSPGAVVRQVVTKAAGSGSVIVTVVESVAGKPWESVAVSVNRTAVSPSTAGAVKLGLGEEWSSRVMAREVELWDHE